MDGFGGTATVEEHAWAAQLAYKKPMGMALKVAVEVALDTQQGHPRGRALLVGVLAVGRERLPLSPPRQLWKQYLAELARMKGGAVGPELTLAAMAAACAAHFPCPEPLAANFQIRHAHQRLPVMHYLQGQVGRHLTWLTVRALCSVAAGAG